MSDPISTFRIQGDDFAYFSASRTWDRAFANLWQPHNSHEVPVFRIWTRLVFSLAGAWHKLPDVTVAACYGLLVVAMVSCGWLVWRETGNATLGLAAMVGLGCTTLLYTAVTYYAASQTLWAGLGVLLTLIALQSWRQRGGGWRITLAVLASLLAVGSWSGGFAVAPVAAAYLWTDGRPKCRKTALAFLALIAVVIVIIFAIGYQTMLSPRNFAGQTPLKAFSPLPGLTHTLQAVPEFLLLGNLGLDCPVTLGQGIIFCGILLLLGITFRCGSGRLKPLEAAGVSLMLLSYLLVYTVRGYLPFSSMRELRWYHTLPQIGAVLTVAGLFSDLSLPQTRRPVSRGNMLAVVGLAATMCILHAPAAERLFLAGAFPLAHEQVSRALVGTFRRHVALELAIRVAHHQRRTLGQLDRVESISRQYGIDRDSILAAFGRFEFAWMPKNILEMLDLPASQETPKSPEFVRAVLTGLQFDNPLLHPAIESLITDLQDSDPTVRLGAAAMLSLLGPLGRPGVPALRQTLQDADPRVRAAAAEALERLEGVAPTTQIPDEQSQ